MNILLINLAGETRRLAFQTQQFNRLGLTFERLEAVTVDDVDEADYQSIAWDWERPLSRPEYACYQSHRNAWQRILASGEPALVLEDDAYVSNGLAELLPELSAQADADLITLEARGRKKLLGKRARPLVAGYQLRRLYQDRSGAAGYVLWPTGAAKLLAKERTHGVALADAQICRTYSLRAYQVEPAPLIQLDCCQRYGIASPLVTQSTILNTRRQVVATASADRRLGCKWRRLLAQLRMARRQLVRSFQASRREVVVDVSRFDAAVAGTEDR